MAAHREPVTSAFSLSDGAETEVLRRENRAMSGGLDSPVVVSNRVRMLPAESTTFDDDELDLRAYLGVLRHRWKIIAVVVAVTVAAALALSLRQNPLYRPTPSC